MTACPSARSGTHVDTARLPFPELLRDSIRAGLRGQAGWWPSDLTPEEASLLVSHGVAPLVYSMQPFPQLREAAIRAAAVEPLREEDLLIHYSIK